MEPVQRKISGTGVFLSLAFFGLAALVIYFSGDQFRLFASGETTTGTVTEKRQSRDSKNVTRYSLAYAYQVGDGYMTGSSSVDESDFERFQENSPLPVTYLPNNPKVSSFEDVLGANCFSISLMIGLFGLIGTLGLLFTIWRWRRS